jgi:hypothetical protein
MVTITEFISYYGPFEDLYLQRPTAKTVATAKTAGHPPPVTVEQELRKALIKAYVKVQKFLCEARKFYGKHTISTHMPISILQHIFGLR